MKRILTLFLLAVGFTAFAQDADCERFRTGKFKYDDPNYGLIVVKRDKATQTEITEQGKIEIQSSIKWVNECKYVLTYQKVLNADVPELIGDTMTVEIMENKGNKYTCRVTNQDGFTSTIEVVKIE